MKKEIEYEHIITKPDKFYCRAGSHITACIKEGIIFSLVENRDIVIVHNEKHYLINPVQITELYLQHCV